MKSFEERYKESYNRISIIPSTSEKFLSFSIYFKYLMSDNITYIPIEMRFIDSLKFLSGSLDKLSSLLSDSQKTTMQDCWGSCDEKFKLLSVKAPFCYDFIKSYADLDEHRDELPEIGHFFNTLTNEECSLQEYDRAKDIWRVFELTTLGQYSDIYLKLDVLLLVDVFENFRSECMLAYEIDPIHFYSLPGFSFDAMLKYTRIQLPQISNIDVYLFLEKGMRGGLVNVITKKAEFNNKYLSSFDEARPVSYGLYIDANNLYGGSLSSYLCHSEPIFLEDTNLDNFKTTFSTEKILELSDTADVGYFFEVDLTYDDNSLHDLHRDMPFAALKAVPPGSKHEKLMCTLLNKESYVIHYRNLRQCLENGLKLMKIHKVLEFRQSNWLKPYIDLNTMLRTNATNDFHKNLFKLMTNSIFGRMLMNTRKYMNVKLTTCWNNIGRSRGSVSYIRSPLYKSFSIINNDLVMITLQNPVVNLDKPIYIGVTVLEDSKYVMYDFHYNFIKKNFGTDVELNYSDTDSYLYTFHNRDPYEIIKQSDYFDTSNYPLDNQYGIIHKNKGVLAKFKDEMRGLPIACFYGVKVYLIKSDMGMVFKKIKGLSRSSAHQVYEKNYSDYIESLYTKPKHSNALMTKKTFLRKMTGLRADLFEVTTILSPQCQPQK